MGNEGRNGDFEPRLLYIKHTGFFVKRFNRDRRCSSFLDDNLVFRQGHFAHLAMKALLFAKKISEHHFSSLRAKVIHGFQHKVFPISLFYIGF